MIAYFSISLLLIGAWMLSLVIGLIHTLNIHAANTQDKIIAACETYELSPIADIPARCARAWGLFDRSGSEQLFWINK